MEAEDQVETLLKEIAQFEEGVRTLEKEMHELSKVETEAKGVLDEEARVELRVRCFFVFLIFVCPMYRPVD